MGSSGKVALITGARRYIGAAIARTLGDAGYSVVVNDLTRDDDVDEILHALDASGVSAEFVAADIADREQVEGMVATTVQRFGTIDVLVNNAYWATHAPFLEIDADVWRRTLDVCLTGYFLCSQAAARRMVEQRTGGSIVNISSVHAGRAWPTDTAYGVAKAGIVRLTESMAVDLGPHGIRANAVLPGYVDVNHTYGEPAAENALTPERARFIPAGRQATPQDIGNAVGFLVSDAAANITGVTLPVDGGFLTTGVP